MLGLILAMVSVAFAIIASNVPANTAVYVGLTFLWYWHVAWTVMLAATVGIVFLAGLAGMFNSKTQVQAFVAAFIASPLLLLIFAMRQALFIGAVCLLLKAGAGANGVLPFAQWDVAYVVLATVMYIGAAAWMKFSFSTKG